MHVCVSGGGAERGGERESQAVSMLLAQSLMKSRVAPPHALSHPGTPENTIVLLLIQIIFQSFIFL